MKKVLGIIFSTVGNIGVLLAFALALTFCAFNALSYMNIIHIYRADYIVLGIVGGAGLLCYIFSKIGTKLDDSAFVQGAYMKFKRGLMKVTNVLLGNILVLLICVFGLVGLVFLGILGLVDKTGTYVDPINILVSAGILLFNLAFFISAYSNYVNRHCPYCGASYSGGEYEYEEEERTYNINNEGKVNRTSKIRFEFICPECGESHVYRKKMSTNAAAVEKYADNIVK